jgi:alpha-L-fucosidase
MLSTAMLIALIGVMVACASTVHAEAASPTDHGPRPYEERMKWWAQSRFGMFIHWGPVTLTGEEIGWSRARTLPNCPQDGKTPGDVYDNLYKRFNPVRFNARQWVEIARRNGMKYIVLTVRHHDGFLLWDSKVSAYNIMHTPFGRDVVRELADACHEAGIDFCTYFSVPDWSDPECRNPDRLAAYTRKIDAQLTEVLGNYGRIPLVWFDFDGYPSPTDASHTASLVRRLVPGVLLNNRLDALHSDDSHAFVGPNGDYATPEQFVGCYCDQMPWETNMTICSQWSWKPNDHLKSIDQLTKIFCSSLGGDGNLLLNVGPTSLGEIEPEQVARLDELGAFVRENQHAVYNTRGGPYTPTQTYASTRQGNTIHLMVYPSGEARLSLPPLGVKVNAARLSSGATVRFEQTSSSLLVQLPPHETGTIVVSLELAESAMGLAPIFPPSHSGSLTYRKPCIASSQLGNTPMHAGDSALDNNDETYWTLGRVEAGEDKLTGRVFKHFQRMPEADIWHHAGWLEVDLGSEQVVTRASLGEFVREWAYSPVSQWRIEHQAGTRWEVSASGESIGKLLDVRFDLPVKARRFRLSVAGPGRPAISRFSLFSH